MRWRPDCPGKSEVVRHQRSGRNKLVSSYLLWFRLHVSGALVFGIRDCVLGWCLVRTASPLTFCGLQVPWYLLLMILPGSWGSCCRTALHSVCTPTLCLTLVYGSTVSASLNTSSLDLFICDVFNQQGPEALPLPGFSPLFIIIELRISSFQLPGRLHHPAVADHSSGHIFLLFLVICYL